MTDRHFVSGSRDGALAVWHVDDTQQEHVVQRKDYENKLDMKRKFEVQLHVGYFYVVFIRSSIKTKLKTFFSFPTKTNYSLWLRYAKSSMTSTPAASQQCLPTRALK